jgi:zinc protease
MYGWALVTGRTVEDVNQRAERIAAVTADDIKKVAKKYLDIKRSVTGLMIPEGKTVASNTPVSVPKPSDIMH